MSTLPGDQLRSALERQALDRNGPPCHADARRQLETAGLKVGQKIGVIHVYPDCILYVDPDGRAMTAWACRQPASSALTWKAQPGFVAERSPYLED